MRLGAEEAVDLRRPVETPQARPADAERIAAGTVRAGTSGQEAPETHRARARGVDLRIEVLARHAPWRREVDAPCAELLLDARFRSAELRVAVGVRQRSQPHVPPGVRADRHARGAHPPAVVPRDEVE